MLDRKDNQRFVSRRAFNTEVTNHRLRQSRARVLSSNQWIIIQRIVMSHSVAVGWHRRGQCRGNDRGFARRRHTDFSRRDRRAARWWWFSRLQELGNREYSSAYGPIVWRF